MPCTNDAFDLVLFACLVRIGTIVLRRVPIVNIAYKLDGLPSKSKLIMNNSHAVYYNTQKVCT